MRFAKGAVILGASQSTNIALTFLSRIILTKILGVAYYGQFGAALNAITLGSRALSLGLAPASQYYASVPGNEPKKVIGTSAVLAFASGLIATLLLWLGTELIAQWLFKEHPQAASAFRMMLPFLTLVMMSMNLGVVLVPLGKIKQFGILQIGGMLPLIAAAAILNQFCAPLVTAAYSQATAWVYVLTFLIWHLRQHIASAQFDPVLAKKMIRYALVAWPNVFLNIGVSRTATLAGAMYMTKPELSWYVLGLNLVEGLVAPLTSMGQLMLSRSATGEDHADSTSFRAIRLTFPFILMLWILAALFGWPVLRYIFGADYVGAYPVMLAMLATASSHSVIRLYSNIFSGRGKPQAITPSLIIEFSALLILIPILGQRTGMWGVVVSSISATLLGLMVAIFRMKKLQGIGYRSQLIANAADYKMARQVFQDMFKKRSKPA